LGQLFEGKVKTDNEDERAKPDALDEQKHEQNQQDEKLDKVENNPTPQYSFLSWIRIYTVTTAKGVYFSMQAMRSIPGQSLVEVAQHVCLSYSHFLVHSGDRDNLGADNADFVKRRSHFTREVPF